MHKKLDRRTALGRGEDRTDSWGRLPVSRSVHHLRTVRPSSLRQGLGRNSQSFSDPEASLWPPPAGKEEDQRCRPRWPPLRRQQHKGEDAQQPTSSLAAKPRRVRVPGRGRKLPRQTGAQKLCHRSLRRREASGRGPRYSSPSAARAVVLLEDPGSSSECSRYQLRNLADCLQKIRDMIAEASQPAKEPSKEDAALWKIRIENTNRERLRKKRISSAVKTSRRVEVD